ncbi:integrase core domain-containing protein, partial [Bacteroides heparinolyticus]
PIGSIRRLVVSLRSSCSTDKQACQTVVAFLNMNIYLNVYEDGVSLWKGLNGYFRFYNQERPHKSLSYKTPANCYYANAA